MNWSGYVNLLATGDVCNTAPIKEDVHSPSQFHVLTLLQEQAPLRSTAADLSLRTFRFLKRSKGNGKTKARQSILHDLHDGLYIVQECLDKQFSTAQVLDLPSPIGLDNCWPFQRAR